MIFILQALTMRVEASKVNSSQLLDKDDTNLLSKTLLGTMVRSATSDETHNAMESMAKALGLN